MEQLTSQLTYDVEIIIDYTLDILFNYSTDVSTHRVIRGLKLNELYKLLKLNNEIPKDMKITINIRGVS